jgi:hypothetical protein
MRYAAIVLTNYSREDEICKTFFPYSLFDEFSTLINVVPLFALDKGKSMLLPTTLLKCVS